MLLDDDVDRRVEWSANSWKRSETHGPPRDGFQRLPLILCNHLHHQNPSERSILLQYVDHPFALCCPSIVADLSDPSNCWHRSIIVSDVVHALESREPQILVQYYSVSKLCILFWRRGGDTTQTILRPVYVSSVQDLHSRPYWYFPKADEGKRKICLDPNHSMYPLCWDRNDGILMIFSVLVKYWRVISRLLTSSPVFPSVGSISVSFHLVSCTF